MEDHVVEIKLNFIKKEGRQNDECFQEWNL